MSSVFSVDTLTTMNISDTEFSAFIRKSCGIDTKVNYCVTCGQLMNNGECHNSESRHVEHCDKNNEYNKSKRSNTDIICNKLGIQKTKLLQLIYEELDNCFKQLMTNNSPELFEPLDSPESLESLESFESLKSFESFESFESLKSLDLAQFAELCCTQQMFEHLREVVVKYGNLDQNVILQFENTYYFSHGGFIVDTEETLQYLKQLCHPDFYLTPIFLPNLLKSLLCITRGLYLAKIMNLKEFDSFDDVVNYMLPLVCDDTIANQLDDNCLAQFNECLSETSESVCEIDEIGEFNDPNDPCMSVKCCPSSDDDDEYRHNEMIDWLLDENDSIS